MSVDPVTLHIVSQAFAAITEEMGANLRRAAYSTIIREAMDYSTGLLDTSANLIAQSTRIPIHLLSMPMALAGCLRKHPASEVTADDVFVTNDPYNGAQHLPDIFVFTPIFAGGRLVGFTGSTGHHMDVGGGGVGSMNPTATDIFQEGLRIPSVKLSATRDLDGGLFDQIFTANIRDPYQTLGDFHAQLIANRTGERRLLDIVAKYGLDVALACAEEIMAYAERRTREEIATIPRGTYVGEDFLDSDVFDDQPLRIRATVHVEGEGITVDFEGTAPQARGPVNAPLAGTVSAVQAAIKSMLTDQTVPPNSGCFRPITVRVPYGSLLNPKPPAPVRARINTACRAFTATMRAMASAIPERVVASGFESTTAIHLAFIQDDHYRIFTEPLRGGTGASHRSDGVDMVSTSMSNCANTPVEAAESDNEWFRIQRYELLQDSGGPGRYRGGLGARREYLILRDRVDFTCFADRHRLRPWGLYGASPGTCGRIMVRRGDKEVRVRPLDHVVLQDGDVLVVETGGGGGNGDPTARPQALKLKDLREGKISARAGEEVYGLAAQEIARLADSGGPQVQIAAGRDGRRGVTS